MTPLLQIAGWTLIHFVWEGCAIAVVAAVATWVDGRIEARRAAVVHTPLVPVASREGIKA